MNTYRVSAEFYIQASSEEEAEATLYDGLSFRSKDCCRSFPMFWDYGSWTESPYAQISRAKRWGYDIDIIDPERMGGQKRSDYLRASTYHAFQWGTAVTKAQKKLAKIQAIAEKREKRGMENPMSTYRVDMGLLRRSWNG